MVELLSNTKSLRRWILAAAGLGVLLGHPPCGMAQAGMGSGGIDYALILPREKVPMKVAESEENPFVAPALDEASKDQVNSEENKVKERLLALRVAGASPRGESFQVLLGDMILEPGMLVPPFFVDQTVRLRVNDISLEAIEFVWLEKERTGLPPRMLLVPINIRPDVRYVLPGQRLDGKGKEIQLGVRPMNPLVAPGDSLPGLQTEVKRALQVDDEEKVVEVEHHQSPDLKKSVGLMESVVDSFFGSSAGGSK